MSVAAQRALVRKMHGTHNVFFVLDERPPRLGAYAELARRLCAGEGTALEADGLLVIEAPPAVSYSTKGLTTPYPAGMF